MLTPFPQRLPSRSVARAALALGLGLILPGAARLQAQTFADDFNNQSDAGWVHYDLGQILSMLTGGTIVYGSAHYSFPANPAGPAGNYAYRIQADAITDDPVGIGRARAGSFWPNAAYGGAPYSISFVVGVDFVNWNPNTIDQDVGMLFMIDPSTIGPGTTAGYACSYQASDSTLYLSTVTGEAPSTIGEQIVALDPTHQYRLVVSSHDGSTFVGTVYDSTQPTTPWTSAIGQGTAYTGTPGVCGLLVFQEHNPPWPQSVDATFDNYSSAPGPATMRAMITDLSPQPGGKAAAVYPTVSVNILNRDTSVNTSSILLWMDGVPVPAGALNIDTQVSKPNNPAAFRTFPGAAVTYSNGVLYAYGTRHTNTIAFQDSSSIWQTNSWTWTTGYPYLFASNSLPLGSLSVRGFDARMVQSDNGGVNLANTLARAQQQLAIPPTIPITRTATNFIQTLNWNQTSDPPNNVPGLCAATEIKNIAVESLAYLELTAGQHRFHIVSDDRSGLYSGVNLTAANTVLWENPDNTANTTFDFFVEAAGLYPFESIWEQTGGGAILTLYSVNLSDLTEVLINDATDPVGVVKAYYPIVCKSASTATGPYSIAASAVNTLNQSNIVGSDCSPTVVGQMVTGGTFTLPIAGAAKFYVLDGPRPTKITGFTKSGSNVVLTYTVQ